MTNDVLSLATLKLRGTDSNSLLRLYDRAKDIFKKSASPQERTRADRALQRIVKELEKRNVPF